MKKVMEEGKLYLPDLELINEMHGKERADKTGRWRSEYLP